MKRFLHHFRNILLVGIIVLTASCKEDVTNPEENHTDTNYTWTVDTIRVYNLYSFYEMYGANENEIWFTGSIMYNPNYGVFKYDGKTITTLDLVIKDTRCIEGTGRDDIWISTGTGEFWHYDGTNWKLRDTIKYNNKKIIVNDIEAISKDNYYACGLVVNENLTSNPILMHYNGINWEVTKFFNNPNHVDQFNSIKYDIQKQYIYLKGYSGYNKTSSLNIYKEDAFTQLIETNNSISIEQLGYKVYSTYINFQNQQSIIYELNAAAVIKVYDFTWTMYNYGLMGNSKNDFFFIAKQGTINGIGHYDGKDMKMLFPITAYYNDSKIINNNIYYLMTDPITLKPLLVKGKKY